jgi:hypothetical protein
MVLPFLAAAITTCPVFLVVFREQDCIRLRSMHKERISTVKWGAISGSALLTATLGVLVGTRILDVPV